jgi:hypothetical protein
VSNISVDFDVLNQRGSPAWFTDTFANIPTAGFVGRMFISKDTFAFYRDTGSGWDLIGGPGIGTLTGSGVVGQVSFFNGTQVLAGNNNLFWDNVNSRLGINTATPGQPLDIHSTGNTLVQLNNTSTGNSNISFQNQDVAKWRVGNVYNAGANSFDIQNASLSANAISISAANLITTTSISCNNSLYVQSSFTANANIFMTNGSSINVGVGVNVIASNSTGFFLVKENSLNWAYLSLASLTAARNFTFPNADGTLALTSNLSSYLPLAGGTLTGALVINPTNTLTIGLDVASNTTRFRSDNLEGNKRQLEITMGSGTLVQITAKGYLANYGTDMAFYTATTSGTNASPGIYITGTNNRVGIKTGTPAYDLDVTGTLGVSSAATFSSSVTSVGLLLNTGSYLGSRSLRAASDLLIFYGGTSGFNFTDSTNSVALLQINNSGQVAIGDSVNSAYQLYVKSTTADTSSYPILVRNSTPANLFYVRSDGLIVSGTAANSPTNYTTGSAANMYVSGGGELQRSTSSLKYKTDVKDYDKGLTKVLQMRPVYYKGKNDGNIQFAGLIAEEIHELGLTEFVQYAEDGTPDALAYANMVALLVKAIQELNEKLKRNNIN